MKSRNQVALAVVLVLTSVGLVMVFSFGRTPGSSAQDTMEGHDHSAMSAGADEAKPVTLDSEAARRIGVTYATVTRGSLPQTVHSVGSVTYDETRLAAVNSKIDGWVETLFVDFTGAPVRENQALMEVYSPSLVTAQEELLLAKGLLERAVKSGADRAMETAQELLQAARSRLEYWDISPEEIQALEERGAISRTLTLRSPASGVVVEKNVVVGARISSGMELFRIADLSRVWVEAEVFEKDLSLAQVGQHGMVSFEAYPGESFHGTVTYLYPTVSPSTRTGRVRLELQNPGLRLKPGMYAQIELHGSGMEETLLVPRSAVLQTGERSMVFHRMASGQLHPMEVVTGLSSGDQLQVLSGLREGQVIVSSATFLIDAESNLGAAMAAMAGMDHSEMDMGSEEEMDPSQHQMDGPSPDTTTTGVSRSPMDHSGHDMSGMVPDTGGVGSHDSKAIEGQQPSRSR